VKQYVRFQQRRGTKAQIDAWQADSIAKLQAGELVFASDTKKVYVSDGTNLYPVSVFTGSGTLTAGTTTTITDVNATSSSVIVIQPTSTAIVALGVYVSAKNNGNFVLTHLAAAGGESFDYVIV
jgi:hypothetical protein